MVHIQHLHSYLPDLEDELLYKNQIVVGLDYDGTLTPIRDKPDQAVLSEKMRKTLKLLRDNNRCRIAVISGRSLEEIKELVSVKDITYIGNHGFEIESPGFSKKFVDIEWLQKLEELCLDLEKSYKSIPGIIVERKGATASIHFRMVDKSNLLLVDNIFWKKLSGYTDIKITHGKKVYEIRPPLEWNKGEALQFLLTEFYGSEWSHTAYIFYIGDDRTDEDVFQIIGNAGSGIIVSDSPPENTAAKYYVRNAAEVCDFLQWLIKH